MKRKILMLSLVAGCLLLTSCASKKELVNLQNENKTLNSSYQDAKEQLASSRTRVTSLEDQLAQERKNNQVLRSAYDALQGSLDKSLQSEFPRQA
jgi:chemotaxis protein MotB